MPSGSSASAWREALQADRPVVFDVLTDPEVPPLPPHITFEQAVGYAQSILRAGGEAIPGLRVSLLQWAEQMMPRGKR